MRDENSKEALVKYLQDPSNKDLRLGQVLTNFFGQFGMGPFLGLASDNDGKEFTDIFPIEFDGLFKSKNESKTEEKPKKKADRYCKDDEIFVCPLCGKWVEHDRYNFDIDDPSCMLYAIPCKRDKCVFDKYNRVKEVK